MEDSWSGGAHLGPPGERISTITPNNADPPATPAGARSGLSLTLHIGTGKTGTSSLQAFSDRNRSRLADAGWLYPRSLGRRRHASFGVWTRPDEELELAIRERRPGTHAFDDAAQMRREVPRRLLDEIEEVGLQRVLISDEGLYGAPEASLERLRRFTDVHASEVRLVCYLRRQDDLLVSHYQQVVKVRATRTLAARVAERDLSATYDYYSRLRTWLRVVQPDRLIVRRFDRDRFRNGSLYDDFVDAAGLGIPADDVPPRDRNRSLDAESVEFLRLLNLYREEHDESGADLPQNRALVPVLAKLGTGPTLTLPDVELDRFMARWEHSNQRVARELLGEASGELFGPRPAVTHTTSEQRLDPARLDHFLELAGIPELAHDRLRRIARREAR